MSAFAKVFCVACFLCVFCLPSIVLATETGSGEIVVTGSVLPNPTSITTKLDASTTQVHQDQEITYTFTYSSENKAAIPFAFSLNWDTGVVAGASEATIDGVEYVVGSATQGSGDTIPIIDTKKRSITWQIASLPSLAKNQTVQFKLKTNSAYSGSRKVSIPVTAAIISPVGVPDKRVNIAYQYQETPASTPTPTPDLTAVVNNAALFRSIEVRSLGATSARIGIVTTTNAGLTLRYGTTPIALKNSSIHAPNGTNDQQFVLVGLLPNTRYYFQVSTTDGALVSDIFTLTTTNRLAEQTQLSPYSITLTQQRAVIYAGQVSPGSGEESQPMTITQNSVFDISLTIPKNQDIDHIDVVIRDEGVLGATSDSTDINELQSTSTKMVKVATDLYIGKLRSPIKAGQYQVIGQLEDVYGNITEQEIGRMQVVRPFTVVDKDTGAPLENAQVLLSLFNQKTQLYETVSNVTAAVTNPSFSDAQGVVQLSLFPGKYRAEVTRAGYTTQTVEFEMGNANTSNFPLVKLESDHSLLGGKISYFAGSLQHLLSSQIAVFREIATTKNVYATLLSIVSGLFCIFAIFSLILVRYPHIQQKFSLSNGEKNAVHKKIPMLGLHLLVHAILFCGEFFVILVLLLGVLFYIELGAVQGGTILLITSLLAGLWTFDAMFLKTHRTKKL